MQTRIIAVSNYKGGVGKTTTASNIAYILAKSNYKVLLIDADPQGSSSYMLWKYSESAKTLKYVLQDKKNIKGAIRRSRFKNLDIIPAIAELEVVNKDDNIPIQRLSEEIKKLEKDRYDYIIIDCQPTMQTLTRSAIYASDLLLVPFNPDGFSVAGLELMKDFILEVEQIRDNDIEYACLVTKLESRDDLKVIMKLMETTDYQLLNTVIRYSRACKTSINARKPLLMHRKKDKATLDYIELAAELTGEDIVKKLSDEMGINYKDILAEE